MLFILSSLPAIVFAAESDVYSGMYINVNTGVAKSQDMPVGSWIGTANVGYSFNRYLAVEGGYSALTSEQFGVNTTTNIIDIAAKGTLPLVDIFGLYGRLGAGYGFNGWSGSASNNCSLCQNNNTNTYALGLAGVGASFSVTRHLDLRVEDTLYVPFASTFNGSTINAVTAGLQVNF